jgi:hypothetical protein
VRLGWSVGDALTCAKYQVFCHLVEVPELDAPIDQWKLLVHQILSRCGQLNNHLMSAKADFDLSAELKTVVDLLLNPPPGDFQEAVGDNGLAANQQKARVVAIPKRTLTALVRQTQMRRCRFRTFPYSAGLDIYCSHMTTCRQGRR